MLEPRVLLSADALAAAASFSITDQSQIGHQPLIAHEEIIPNSVAHSQHSAYNPATQVDSIFEGLTTQSLASAQVGSHHETDDHSHRSLTPETTAAQIVAGEQTNSEVELGVQQKEATVATIQHRNKTHSANTISKSATAQKTSSAPVAGNSGSSTVQQLTSTLKAANAPPAATSTATSVVAQTSEGNTVTTTSGAGKSATPTPLAAPSPSLQQYINDEIAAHNASFTVTKTVDSLQLSDFLTLNGITLVFNATLNNGTWSGSVSISADSAVLFPGKSFSATISNPILDTFTLAAASSSVTLTHTPLNNSSVAVRVNGNDVANSGFTVGTNSGNTVVTFPSSQPKDTNIEVSYMAGAALTGTYTIGGTYSLTAANLSLNIGDALAVVATSVHFTYDSAGASNQQLVQVTTGKVTSSQFTGFSSADLTNFRIRADGFSFDQFTLSSNSGSTPALGSILAASSVTLTATNFNVTFGSTPSLTGSITLTASDLQLFPNGGFVQLQATAVTGSYDFSAFDGTSSTGQLSLSVTGFQLSMGEAFKIVASGTVTISPTQTEIAKITSATLSSPQFSQLGSVTLTDFTLTQTGFSFADLTLTTGGSPAAFSDFLTFDSLSVAFTNFSFAYGAQPQVNGTVELSAANVVLFPGISFINLHLGDLTGAYTFGGSAILSIGVSNLDISIGEALTVHLGHVTIQPSQSVILHISDATVTSNLFSGLETATISSFDLTPNGFSLGSFTLNVLSGETVSLGGFLEFGSISVNVNSFSVDKTKPNKVSGSITLTIGDLTLFPGNTLVTSSFGTITAQYDFGSPTSVGQLTIQTQSFSLSIANQLVITGSGITITPDQETIATVNSATLTLSALNNLAGTITSLDIKKNGFSLASATVSASDITIGGVLAITSPSLTFTNISYTTGDSLSGSVSFNAGVTVNLGATLHTSASQLTADYNFQTHVLNASMNEFKLDVGGFVSIDATGVALSYSRADDGSAKLLVGATGVAVLMGSNSGGSSIGVQISNASLALAVFSATDGTITYALDASGGIGLVGLPANTLSLSAAVVKVRYDNAGAVDEQVNVDSNPDHAVHLLYENNEQSLVVSGLTLTISNFVTLNGNFGFQTFTDSVSGLTDVLIGASDVTAVLGTNTTNLTISGASFGLIIRPGTGGNPTTYALIANGGTDTLNGVPGVSLSATGLSVKVNTTGLDPETLSGMPQTIATPDGDLPIDFSTLGGGNSTRVEGSITLTIANFISLQGKFAFQSFTDSATGRTDILVAATEVETVLGTSSANLTISGASLGLAIVSGATANSSTYMLVVDGGTDTLNGVPGLSVSASGLKVRINTTSADPATLGIPTSLETPGGSVSLDFGDLGSGFIKDIQGTITLTVLDFITLHGDFGFQSFTDSTTGQTNMVIGAKNISAVLGTDAANLTIDGASLGVLIISGSNGTPTRYALMADGGTDTLNGIPGLSFLASGLAVKINNLGADPSLLPGIPTSVHTPGGDISLNFSGLGAGATKTVEGTITLGIANFISLHGSFSFQTFTDLITNKTDIAVAATDVFASLTVGNVSLTIDGASLGLVIIPGATAGQSTYALVANGGTDSLTGVPGLSLSASGLSVRINSTGLDLVPHIGTTTLQTPGGSVDLDFSDLGSGAVMAVQGHITLDVLGFVSLTGDFGFQRYTDSQTSQTQMLIGATNLDVVLGTSDTNLTITGASLGLIILSGATPNSGTYALVANAGTASLNGVPGLTLTSTGLAVKINNTGLDAATLAAQPVKTSGGDVVLDFTGLGSGNVTHVEGTVTLGIADFVSITGSFVFTKQVDPNNSNITKIIIGANGVSAFLGIDDQSIGVWIHDAKMGLVIYKNTLANTTTYALYASTQIETVGLPSEITLTGNAALMVNNTGKAIDETITTPAGDVEVKFTDGTSGTADQRNIKAFGGGLTLTINAGTSFTLSGNFAFSKTGTGTSTKVLIGAAGVTCSNIIPDGGSASLALVDGSLGVVIFSDAGGGYALTASATVAAGAGNSGASATVTIRRNTTTHAVNEVVSVGTAAVQVKFSSTEIKTGTTAFQSIALSDATINIENIFIITAGGGSTSTVGGVTTRTLTNISLTVQDPGTGKVLFTISASSASYITIAPGTAFDGLTWTNGGTQIVLNDLSFSLGSYVTFTGDSVKIRHYTNASNASVNSFNFTQATVALYMDGSQMVALQGNLAFHYSTVDGFVLDSTGAAPITGFSFLGQSIGAVSSGSPATSLGGGGTAAAAPPATGTHTLGPITFGTPSIAFSNFSFGLDGTLSVTVSISDTLASISGTVVSAAVRNITGSFTLGLKLDLANPFSAPTNITATGFNITIGQLEISIGVSSSVSLKLTATNVHIDPTAGSTQDLVSFGGTTSSPGLAATLSVPGLTLTGGASNFSIKGDGSFVAGNNFSVTLSLGENSSGSLKWPDWLPIKNVSISVLWPNGNFNSDPGNFILDLSATVDLSSLKGIPLTLSGTINHVRIDTGKLAAGEFPIISIDSVAVSVTGNLFGGTVEGSLLAGVVRFDSNGAVVDADGKLVSNGQQGVGPITSVFYGGVSASFSFGGMTGFSIRIGLSQYGPLSLYISASTPTGILLDPQSGLTINNFRGGVTFGQGLPTVNVSNPIEAEDALQLRQNGFNSPATLTDDQWLAQMKSQVATLYKNGATDGWSNLGASTITIQAGATIYDAYLSQNAFKIDADVFFDTSGKILILGTATFGNSLTIGMKLYADLAPVFNGSVNSGTPVNLLFLIDFPAQTGTPITPPILSIYGVMQFEFSRTDGTPVTAENQADAFQINIAGAAELNVMGGFKAKLSGNVSLTFTATSFQIVISDVNLNVSYLGDIGQAAGNLTIQKNASGSLDIWGAFVLTANLSALESVGIHASGQFYFELNTTAEIKNVPLILTSGTINVDLQPQSFSLFISGAADFDLFGTRVFTLSGTLAVNVNINTQTDPATFTLTIFVQAQLEIGPAGSPFFTFNANGLIYVDNTGFAAKVALSYGGSPLTGFTLGVNWLLVMNTTGQDITYEIPSPLPTSPPTAPVPTVMGPNFTSSNVLALTSYETVQNGHRYLIIPKGAPPSGTTNFANWTATVAGPYVILLGRGNLTLANAFTISGSINLIASYNSLTGLSFQLSVNAKLNLTVNGTTIFSFAVVGGLQIDQNGLVAALSISLASGFSMPSNLGFTLSVSFTLQINTTSSAVTVFGTSITVQPGARISASGTLSVPGLTMTGSFVFAVTPSSLSIHITASINVFGARMGLDGFAGIYYDSHPGFAFSIQLKVGSTDTAQIQPVSALGNLFSISGKFTLQINTCGVTRESIAPGFKIAITNLDVFLFGFHLSGSISITISSAGLSILIPQSDPLTLDFFGIVTLNFYGYLNPNGQFSFTASASFSFGEPGVAYIGGSISVTVSNSGFSATVAGRVDFLGVSVSASGTITITNKSVDMSIHIRVVLVPAINIDTDAVEVWGVTIIPAIHIHTPAVVVEGTWNAHLGETEDPPPPPPTPVLAASSGNNLILNLGVDATNRGSAFAAQTDEEYILTRVAGDPGSSTGQTIDVTALGYTQRYYNVTNIIVHDTSTSNATIQIANSVTATADITLGNGNNTITTGGGYATIRDKGTGINTITGGTGGGVYSGGLNASNAPYSTKGITTINNGPGTFSVQYAGYANYTLTQTLLQAGNYLIYLNGVNSVSLTATSASGAHIFNLFGWYGSGSITGSGTNNTLNVNPQTGLNTAFVLSNTALQTTIGANSPKTMTLSGLQTANIVGGSAANTYTVSGWTGTGSLTGPVGSTNTVIAASNANFNLTNSLLTRSGFGDLQLTRIQNAILSGGAGVNTFTIDGTTWTGHATLNGVGGNDTYNLTLTGLGTTWFTIADPAVNSGDVLNVTISMNPLLTATQLRVGTQLVDYSGVGVFNISGTLAGMTYNVRSTSAGTVTNLITFGANNIINVGSSAGSTPTSAGTLKQISGALTISGNGSDTLNLDDTGSNTTKTGSMTSTSVNGFDMAVGGIGYSGVSVLTLNMGSGSDVFSVISTNAATLTTVNAGLGNDTINVGSTGTSGSLSGIAGRLVVNGQGGSNILNLDDTGALIGKTGCVTSSLLTGFGMGVDGVSYNNFAALNISMGAGNDVLNVLNTNAATVVTVNTGAGQNVINVSSNAPVGSGGVLTGIANKLIVYGQGTADTLNVDDSGDLLSATLNLTSSTLTGLGMANNDAAKGIEFHGLETLNVFLASNNNTLYLRGSQAGAVTNITTGSGVNAIAVGTAAQTTPAALVNGDPVNSGSTLSDILGTINILGSGNDTLSVDDTGSATAKAGTLSATSLSGLGMGGSGILYSGVSQLTISLGTGNDTLTIAGTAAIPVTINGNVGNDIFNIQATTGVTNINGGSDNDTFNLGSLAPGIMGNVNSIAGTLNLIGNFGSDVLNVDDSGDSTANTGVLIATTLTGLGLGSTVNYDTVEAVNINLGSGSDTFNIQSTGVGVTTTLSTGTGIDMVNIGSNAPVSGGTVDAIQGPVVIVGSGNDIVNVDDSGDTTANSGLLVPATLTGLGLGSSITYSGLDALHIYLGSGDDTFTVNDMTDATIATIDGGSGSNSATLNFTHDFAARELTLTHFQTATLTVAENFTGLLNDDGTITAATIGGSLTSTGVLNAGAINAMTINVDLAGLINVTGLLDSLQVNGGTSGKVIAGDIHTIRVLAGYGTKVFQVIEGGIERQIQALDVQNIPMPSLVTFSFIYDSVSSDVPQLVIRINNASPTSVRFDLALVTYSATAKFNLARVDAIGNSGINTVAVEGDVLTTISQLGLDFLGLPAGSRSGVILPLDNIVAVAVRDTLNVGVVDVAGIEGLAFGVLVGANGKPVNVQLAFSSFGKPIVLWNLLGSQAAILPAIDTFLIPFSEAQPVQVYAQLDTDLSLDYVLTFTDQILDGAGIRAHVQIQPAYTRKQVAVVASINIAGDGASLNSEYSIGNITSTGVLGDLIVGGKQGLGGVIAAGIFGNINVLAGSIYGNIETTGVRIDPITADETAIEGTLGRALYDAKGQLIGVTTISAKLGISGSLIVRGDLISAVKAGGNLTGVIAVQGNIGFLKTDGNGNAIVNAEGKLTRFGGITGKNGNAQIIALGNIYGDVVFSGTFSGRIAAQGSAVAGLAAERFGILGNVTLKNFTASAVVISGGMIGDVGRTVLSLGKAQGFVAAEGAIALAKSAKIPTANVYANLFGAANGLALAAVFTDGSSQLTFDTSGALQGLALIEADLANLTAADGTLGGTTP